MSLFSVPVQLVNGRPELLTDAEMKVDTGSHFTMLTTELIGKLELAVLKDPLTRQPIRPPISFADGSGFQTLLYGPVMLHIPVTLPDGSVVQRWTLSAVIEGKRNILGVTQLEVIGAAADPVNCRLIDVPIEM